MSAVTIDMTVVVTQINLAICWKTRVSDSTRKSENLFSADYQQGRFVNFNVRKEKRMGLFDDVAYQMSMIQRQPGESNESLARRLYKVQMDVYSANAGSDIISMGLSDPFRFENLDPIVQKDWIEKAKTYN